MSNRFYKKLSFRAFLQILFILYIYIEVSGLLIFTDMRQSLIESEIKVAKNNITMIKSTLSYIKSTYIDKNIYNRGTNYLNGELTNLISSFTNVSEISNINKNGTISIIDQNGTILLSKSRSLIGKNLKTVTDDSSFGSNFLKQIEDNKKIEFFWEDKNSNFKRHKVTAIVDKCEFFNWYIIVTIYHKDIDNYVKETEDYLFKISIISFLLISIGVFFFAKIEMRPINKLTEITQKATKGNFNIRANINRDDEIGILAKNFDLMIEELSLYVNELDSKVKQRTYELEELNKFLEKRVEIEIKNRIKNELLYTTLFNNNRDGLLIYNYSRESETLKLINTNSQVFNIFGNYSSCDLEIIKYINSEVINFVNIKENENLTLFGYERDIKSNQKELHIDFSFSTFLMDKKDYIYVILRDISDKIEQERERKEQEQILIQQSKNAQMGEMIGNIAHQWRQPLAIVSSSISDIEMDLALDVINQNKLENNLQNISKSIKYLSETIDDFRNFFKPDKDKETISFKKLIDNANIIIKKSIEKEGINYNINGDFNSKISTYKNEITQVFINILKNATDELKDKNIKKPKITISFFEDKKSYFLYFDDNAGGIKEELIDKIFEPYFSTKDSKQGTGLGLYMSKVIIEKHCGGEIYAQNIDNGARFVIKFKKDIF